MVPPYISMYTTCSYEYTYVYVYTCRHFTQVHFGIMDQLRLSAKSTMLLNCQSSILFDERHKIALNGSV